MTKREQEILELIKSDPWISQKEIALRLGITRSSVGVHILNLTRKGMIKGKKYILGEENYALVIGGANIDISGFPDHSLRFNDSNPGSVRMSLGGVGRNIAENLSRLDVCVKMLSAVGGDVYGDKILADCRTLKIDMDAVKVIDDGRSSIYLSIQDEAGEMVLALSDMDITNRINIDYINKNNNLIENASAVVVEANLSAEVLDYLLNNFRNTRFFVDPVSTAKAGKLAGLLHNIHTLTCNRYEAEIISGIKIESDSDFEAAAGRLVSAGISEVYINRGVKGTCYGSEDGIGFYSRDPYKMANSNGAGDAFMAGLVYSSLNDMNVHQKVKFASAASALTVLCNETVNPSLSTEKILEIIE